MKRDRSKLKLAQGSDTPWTSVEFASSLDRARQIETDILDQCEKNRFNEDDIFAIKLALEEALVNAVKHGNKMDPAKMVRVQYHVTKLRVDIVIEDQGPGFNPASIPNPTDDTRLEMCSGRGIHLMRAFMSSVVYNPRGNMVTLTKLNEGYRADGSLNSAMA